MEQRKCKNKKCQRPLPDEYKYKYCENCRNEQVKHFKVACIGVLGFAMIGGIVTKGKNKPTKK
jgi:hypothetical protein